MKKTVKLIMIQKPHTPPAMLSTGSHDTAAAQS
jgi:hypothetical protein